MAEKVPAYCPYEDKDCDCFALLIDGECYALNNTEFKDGVCRFYKTEDRADVKVLNAIRKVNRRKEKALRRIKEGVLKNERNA